MRWFINVSTRTKLTLGFGLVIILFMAVITTAFFSNRALREADGSIQDILEFRNDFNGQRASLLVANMLPPGPEQDALFQEVKEYSTENMELMKRLQALYRSDAQLSEKLQEMVMIRDEYAHTRDEQVIPMIRQQKPEEAKALILGVQKDRYQKVRSISRDFTKTLDERSESRLTSTHWTMGILSGLALMTALAMVIGLGRLIANPLEEITKVANKIAEGELNTDISINDRSDEIGKLAQTFQRMSRSLKSLALTANDIAAGDLTVDVKPQSDKDVLGNTFAIMTKNLRRVVKDLTEAINVLASTATEILASSTQLASGAAETATAVTETTTTIEEVKQTSLISSQKARSVSEEAQKAAIVAKTGKRSVEQTIEGMEGIRRQMAAIAESILNLSAQGQAIGEIITTVDDMAAQSRLLAVNASIEAAKAGEEGKGFAVVAQEVKSLAEQSKQATAQVRTILKDIQKATSNAVLATEQGSKAVEAGVDQSVRAGESIGALTDSIAQAAQAATQIAATNQQQFVGMDQVAIAMENVKIASTQTMASTKQAETAARQLHDLGQKLKDLTNKFKV